MADVVVILISGDEMKANLTRGLAESGAKPWAFGDWKSQMQAITAGLNVAFVEMVTEGGSPVNRFTGSGKPLFARRAVLGRVSSAIDAAAEPYFPGYPYEFWFELDGDHHFEERQSIDETAVWLNGEVSDLELEPAQLRELIAHVKSNKIGVFMDGAPRKAGYFASRARPVVDSEELPPVAPTPTAAPEVGSSDLPVAFDAFVDAVDESGLIFRGPNVDLPRVFLAALTAKPFALLSGLSGSGKTQLARALGQWLGEDDHGNRRYAVVPVRPDWTSPEAVLGYEDALLPSEGGRRGWSAPTALRFMLRSAGDPDHLYLLVLDEMNMAHVERYFADVLSGIESNEPVLPNLALEDDGMWRVVPGGVERLPMPRNLLVVGTVNVDETTYQFSPKVLDRAFSFDFRVSTDELSIDQERPRLLDPAQETSIEAVRAALTDDRWQQSNRPANLEAIVEQLEDLHRRLADIGFEFGHRTFYEAGRFAALLAAAGIDDEERAVDWILMTKVLPRLHGSRRQLEPFLQELLTIAAGEGDKPVMPMTARKVGRMVALVRANQFVSFAE